MSRCCRFAGRIELSSTSSSRLAELAESLRFVSTVGATASSTTFSTTTWRSWTWCGRMRAGMRGRGAARCTDRDPRKLHSRATCHIGSISIVPVGIRRHCLIGSTAAATHCAESFANRNCSWCDKIPIHHRLLCISPNASANLQICMYTTSDCELYAESEEANRTVADFATHNHLLLVHPFDPRQTRGWKRYLFCKPEYPPFTILLLIPASFHCIVSQDATAYFLSAFAETCEGHEDILLYTCSLCVVLCIAAMPSLSSSSLRK